MTDSLCLASGLLLGIALGLWCGQMLLALLAYWRSISTLVKSFKAIVMYLFGAGGGAVIIGVLATPGSLILYAAGIGIGLIIGRFLQLPALVKEMAKQRETLERQLPDTLPTRELLINLATKPPRRVQFEGDLSEERLMEMYKRALDKWREREHSDTI